MSNFDFKKYLAEGKLYEVESKIKPGEINRAGAYNLKWTVSDFPTDAGTVAKKYDFEYEIIMEDSSLVGLKIKDSVVMAMSDDSTGVFQLGEDIEKYTGLTLKGAQEYKETPDDAYIYGLVNTMNGGKDLFFWNNGTRLSGEAKIMGALPAVVEQIAHEAGIHLTRVVLVRMAAIKLGVSIDSDEWVTHDYGFGEYSWPAIGDPNDQTPEIIAIDEETFATSSSAMLSMLTDGFLEMSYKYVPGLPKIK